MADSSQGASETPNQPVTTEPVAAAVPVATAADPSPVPAVDPKAAPAAASAAAAVGDEPAKPAESGTPAEPAKPVIPETYTIKAPEGIKIDDALLPAMAPIFKEAGLTQEAVDKLAGAFLTFQAKQQAALPALLMSRDLEVTMKDPKLGGLNYATTQANVNRALAAFTDVPFRQFLDKAGIGNRLEFVRVFDRIGRAMAGDTAALNQPDAAGEESQADRIYGRAKKV